MKRIYTQDEIEKIAAYNQEKKNKHINDVMKYGTYYVTETESGYIYKSKVVVFEIRTKPANVIENPYKGELPPWHESL